MYFALGQMCGAARAGRRICLSALRLSGGCCRGAGDGATQTRTGVGEAAPRPLEEAEVRLADMAAEEGVPGAPLAVEALRLKMMQCYRKRFPCCRGKVTRVLSLSIIDKDGSIRMGSHNQVFASW